MQEIKIIVKKDAVFEEVAKTSAYIGGKNVDNNGNSLFDQVFVTEEDREMLERFWQDALNSISFVMGDILISTDVDTDGDYTVRLKMTDNFPESQIPGLQSTVTNYVVNAMVAEWSNLVAKTEADIYSAQATALLSQTRNAIYTRCRPTRNF